MANYPVADRLGRAGCGGPPQGGFLLWCFRLPADVRKTARVLSDKGRGPVARHIATDATGVNEPLSWCVEGVLLVEAGHPGPA